MNPDITLLHDLVSIDSPSTEEHAASTFLAEAMQARGYDQAFVDDAGNAVGVWGSGPREIVLLGHIDTVLGHIPVRYDGDLLYGRGSVDAKGPLACFVSAVARLPKHEQYRLVVVGAVEEEAASSKGARHVIERYHPECFVIGEPSQWHAVTLGYKGRLLIDYTLHHAMAHSAGQLPSGPELAVGFWNTLTQHAATFNAGKPVFDTLDTSLRSIQSTSDGLHEVVTQRIGLRLPLDYDIAALQDFMHAQAGTATLEFSGYEIAHKSDKKNPLVKAFLKAIREQGGDPKFKVKTGTSDMNVLAPHWQCPVVAYGPGDSSLDHTPHEHINLQDYTRAVDVLTRVLHLLVAPTAAAA